MANLAFSSQGATPLTNVLPAPKPINISAPAPIAPKPVTSAPTVGGQSVIPKQTTPGLLPGVNTSTQQKVTTVSPQGTTTTTHPAQSNPSVLAQQQALNKLGAGLVEDGISGPKTSAAIAAQIAGTLPGQKTTTPTPTTGNQPGAINPATGKPWGTTSVGNNATPAQMQATVAQNQQPTTSGLINSSNNPSPSPTPTPPTTPTPTDTTTDTTTPSPYTANPALYGQLTTGLANMGQSQAYTDAQKAIQGNLEQQKELQQNFAEQNKNIDLSGVDLSLARGQEGALGQLYAAKQGALAGQYSGLSSQLGAANTQQGLQQGALGTAAGLAAPQYPSYSNAQYNPVTQTYNTVGGGQYGSGPGAASNIQSVQDATSKINIINQSSDAINNNFSRAINYAQTAGLTGNSPILAGFQKLYGENFATNPSVIGFNQAVGALNTQLQSFGETPIDPNKATQQTLSQAQETVKKDLLTQKSNYQSFIDNFNKPGSTSNTPSGGSAGGTMFGSFF